MTEPVTAENTTPAPSTPEKNGQSRKRWKNRKGLSPEATKASAADASATRTNGPRARVPATPNSVAGAGTNSAHANSAVQQDAAAATVTQPEYVTNGVVNYAVIPAWVVLGDPKRYLSGYVQYWMENLPDMTDKIKFSVDDLQFWMKVAGKVTKGPHKQLTAMCGKWVHNGVDFAISECFHCIKFMKRGEEHDLTVQFILVVHLVYVSQMHGRPSITSNAAQKVLKYMMSNVPLVVKAWRQRLYHYASATIFNECTADLKEWIFTEPGEDMDEINKRKRMLIKLVNYDRVSCLIFRAHFLLIKAHICFLSSCTAS